MRGYRIILLIGVLVALIFFYLGLNEWIYSNKNSASPPPVVYKERNEKELRRELANNIKEAEPGPKKEVVKRKRDEEVVDKKHSYKKDGRDEKKLMKKKTADKEVGVKEKNVEKRIVNKRNSYKARIVQIGAFSKEKNAKVAMKKANGMGYKVTIVKEDGFYKVRVYVNAKKFREEFSRLKRTFGGAIVIK